MIFKRRKVPINLALQGGGAHGAFTWGVLDRLLEEPSIEIAHVSATSAGAVNAVALAAGLALGGPEGARARLRAVWEAVHKAGVPDFLRLNPFLMSLSRSTSLAQVASLMSPYQFNPMGFDPLRKLLTDEIDFAVLRRSAPVELLIAATEISTGRPRFFRRPEMTVEAVLASACLPTMHHCVVIDGVAYWDGGFSANPDLVTLAEESPARDTLIIQLNPLTKSGVPRDVGEISAHANRLTFNAPLLRDVQLIAAVRASDRGWLGPQGPHRALALARFHLIEAGRYTSTLAPDSKMKPDWRLFSYLHEAGRTEMHKWLERHRADLGRRETVDLATHFLAPRVPVPEPAATEPRIKEKPATAAAEAAAAAQGSAAVASAPAPASSRR